MACSSTTSVCHGISDVVRIALNRHYLQGMRKPWELGIGVSLLSQRKHRGRVLMALGLVFQTGVVDALISDALAHLCLIRRGGHDGERLDGAVWPASNTLQRESSQCKFNSSTHGGCTNSPAIRLSAPPSYLRLWSVVVRHIC